MILAAQADALSQEKHKTLIPTTNVRLALFAPARIWRDLGV
jgi:hypothetical protein